MLLKPPPRSSMTVSPAPALSQNSHPCGCRLFRGQIYFWEVAEEGRDLREQRPQQQQHHQHKVSPPRDGGSVAVGWQPRGRLLAVVPKAHDGSITDMSYLPHGEDGRVPPPAATPLKSVQNPTFEEEAGEGGGASELGRLATCGADGTLRLWGEQGGGRRLFGRSGKVIEAFMQPSLICRVVLLRKIANTTVSRPNRRLRKLGVEVHTAMRVRCAKRDNNINKLRVFSTT